MYCKKCGEKLIDDAVFCPKCGYHVDPKNTNRELKFAKSKAGMGVLLGLFLGAIGLIAGLLLYPEETVARKTFVKSWIITVVVIAVLSLTAGIVAAVVLGTKGASPRAFFFWN